MNKVKRGKTPVAEPSVYEVETISPQNGPLTPQPIPVYPQGSLESP